MISEEKQSPQPPMKARLPAWRLILIASILAICFLLAGIILIKSSSVPSPVTGLRPAPVTPPIPTTGITPIQTTGTPTIPPTIATPAPTTTAARQVTTPTPKPTQKDVFSQTGVEYFIDESGGYVEKWTKSPVLVEIRGNPDSESLSCVSKAMAEINQLSSRVKLRTGSIGDSGIVIHFAPKSELRALYPEKAADGLTQIQETHKCEIILADIWINNNSSLDPVQRCTIIRHELIHGLGFEGHTQRFRNSIMYKGYPFISDYSALDREIIRMMYSTDIPLCASESEVRAYFSP